MKSRTITTLVFGLWLGANVPGYGQQAPAPGKAPVADGTHFPMPKLARSLAPNPMLAQTVARALRESGQLSRYQIQVLAYGEIVDLVGDVANESQRMAAIQIARQVPGIAAVRDWLDVRPDPTIVQTQAPVIPPQPLQAQPFQPQPFQPQPFQPQPFQQLQPQQLQPPQPFGLNPGPGLPPRIDGQLQEPTPIFQPMPGPNPMMQPPPMPPYAFPSVAPYNNYSRVAYPKTYPYEQFPFIGPMYPFPRVPLGWRSVSLTWEDGHWWFHRNPTGHDWWRVRYW